MQVTDLDFEKLMIHYVMAETGETNGDPIYLYPTLTAHGMYTDEGLANTIQTFLTAVHVLHPKKANDINQYLLGNSKSRFGNSLIVLENNQSPAPNMEAREKAYQFLQYIIK